MGFDERYGLKNGKGLFIAYDHGVEHPPYEDFKDIRSADPLEILRIAYEGEVNGVVLTPGVALKYDEVIEEYGLKVIVKINSKTKMAPDKYFSSLTALPTLLSKTSDNIKGIAYTVYFGSPREQEMMEKFTEMRDFAWMENLDVFLWAYPRGEHIKKDNTFDLISYAARVGMELGADAIKIKAPENIEDLEHLRKYVHRTKIFVAGGERRENFLENAKVIYKYTDGIIGGRNIWGNMDKALEIIQKIKELF